MITRERSRRHAVISGVKWIFTGFIAAGLVVAVPYGYGIWLGVQAGDLADLPARGDNLDRAGHLAGLPGSAGSTDTVRAHWLSKQEAAFAPVLAGFDVDVAVRYHEPSMVGTDREGYTLWLFGRRTGTVRLSVADRQVDLSPLRWEGEAWNINNRERPRAGSAPLAKPRVPLDWERSSRLATLATTDVAAVVWNPVPIYARSKRTAAGTVSFALFASPEEAAKAVATVNLGGI